MQEIAQAEMLRRPEEMLGFQRRLGGLGDALGFADQAAGFRSNARMDSAYARANFGNPRTESALEYEGKISQFEDAYSFANRANAIGSKFGNLGLAGQAAIAGAISNQLPSSSELIENIKRGQEMQFDRSLAGSRAQQLAGESRYAL